MNKHQKLELTWIGKDQRPRLEPRILLEDPSKSYHAKQRVTDADIFDNRLFKGDADRYRNFTLKRIPKMVLSRCEWGQDNYSLNVANLPMAQPKLLTNPSTLRQVQDRPGSGRTVGVKGSKTLDASQVGLFGDTKEGGTHGKEA